MGTCLSQSLLTNSWQGTHKTVVSITIQYTQRISQSNINQRKCFLSYEVNDKYFMYSCVGDGTL